MLFLIFIILFKESRESSEWQTTIRLANWKWSTVVKRSLNSCSYKFIETYRCFKDLASFLTCFVSWFYHYLCFINLDLFTATLNLKIFVCKSGRKRETKTELPLLITYTNQSFDSLWLILGSSLSLNLKKQARLTHKLLVILLLILLER